MYLIHVCNVYQRSCNGGPAVSSSKYPNIFPLYPHFSWSPLKTPWNIIFSNRFLTLLAWQRLTMEPAATQLLELQQRGPMWQGDGQNLQRLDERVFLRGKHCRNWAVLVILVSKRNLRFPESSPNFNSARCFQLHFGMIQIYSNDKTPSYVSRVLPSYSIDLAGQTWPDQWTLALNDEWRRKTTKSCWNIYQVIGLNSQDDFNMF